MPPAEPPRSSRSKRPKPKPPSARQVQRQTQGALPLSSKPVRPKPVRQARRAQRQTRGAMPLDNTPGRPPVIERPPAAKVKAKPLSSTPLRNIRAGKPVVAKKQERAVAVAAYDQLPSGAAKRAHVKAAQKRIQAGHGTNVDKAVVHIHQSRVQGTRNVQRAIASYNALAGQQVGGSGPGLHLETGATVRGGSLYDAKGSRVGKAPPTKADLKKQGSVANMPSVGKVAAVLGPIATKGLDRTSLPKVIKNIPKDAGELAVTSPTAVARTIDVAIHHPKQALDQTVQPYKDLAKHPGKFIENKPVTAALMLNPLARAPGRLAGKVLRTTGKQTLEREAAVLPATALKEARTGSRAAGRRVVQSVKDKRAAGKGGQPQVTARQLDQRVDEAFASSQHHGARVRSSMAGTAKKLAEEHPKGSTERADMIESGRLAAKGAVKHDRQRGFAKEFGATARVEDGRIIENPHATEGHLHTSTEDAHAVADHLNSQGITIKRGHGNLLTGDPVGRVYARDDVPVKFVVRKAGQKYAVLPEQVAQRLSHHQSVGSTQARGAKILRTSRSMFTKAVLPYRPSWLSGQGIEGTVRAAIKQAGPTSYLRAKRYVAAKERAEPGSGKAFLERTVPSGLIGRHQFDTPDTTFHSEFPESNVARALTDLGKTPGIKQVRALNSHVTKFIFNKVNAKFLEGVPQTAMLGKVLKDSPLMERKVIGLSNKAMDEAVRNEHGTTTQVQLLREIQKSYGKYEGFSPHIRELISHWTPFLPWYINTAKFLLSTLPKDHPLATGLIADMDAATEDWRKQQGLSFRDKTNRVPGFMLGGYPVSGNGVIGKTLGLKKGETHILRIGHYTPAGIGSDVLGATSGLPLPQFSGFYNAMLGLDWKNQPLKHEDGSAFSDSEKFVYGLTQLAEAMVPLSGQVASVTGVPGMEAAPADKGEALKKLVRPISAVQRKKDQGAGVKVVPVKVKPVKIRPVRVKPVQTGG